LPKTVDDSVTLSGILGTMQRCHLVVIRNHPLSDLICSRSVLSTTFSTISSSKGSEFAYLTENDTLADMDNMVQLSQDLVFLGFGLAIQVKLTDVVHTDFLFGQLDLVRVGSKPIGKAPYFLGECS
jgi:hypothetical protein